MKYALVLGFTLFSGIAFANEGAHGLSSEDNPHANGVCASKKGKVAQFHQFHEKDWKQAESEKKVDGKPVKKVANLKDFI